MLEELILKTATNEVQDFIFSHESEDEKKIVLSEKEILGLPAAWIAQQIAGRRRVKEKLPEFYRTKGIIYPPTIHLEQSSSSATAAFKSNLISGDELGVDLTGGFGVDSFFFAQKFKTFFVVEPDHDLLTIVRHNHQLLGIKNAQYVFAFAENFLTNHHNRLDFIFVDPSRRNKQQKVFKFNDCSPNVVTMRPHLLQRAKQILIKASPLIDLQQGQHELESVNAVNIVSVENECKELLFSLGKTVSSPQITASDLGFEGKVKNTFSFPMEEERSVESNFSPPQQWLYEPNASILKSGAFKLVGNRFKAFKLHPNSHLYTSTTLIEDFPGRIFKLRDRIKLDKHTKSFFPDARANILIRNFPLSVEEVKKKTGLREGGELYLICTQSQQQKDVIVAERIFKK